RISSIVLRASAVRLASAIKPTIRWPLSYQEKHVATVNRLNTKNVETKVAIKGAGEIDMELLYADEDRLSRSAHHCGPAKSRTFNRYRFNFPQLAAKRVFQTGIRRTHCRRRPDGHGSLKTLIEGRTYLHRVPVGKLALLQPARIDMICRSKLEVQQCRGVFTEDFIFLLGRQIL